MDPLYELLAPYFDRPDSPSAHLLPPTTNDPQTANYLNRLSALSLSNLASTEPASLLQAAQSHLRNLQALSKRSHKAIINSSSHISNLTTLLPSLESQAQDLHDGIPVLESAAASFAAKYDRNTENAVLDRRKMAMLLSRNIDRVSDILDLPTLLSSTVSAARSSSSSSASSSATSYSSALDLHAHVKRLNALYPSSRLVSNISKQAEAEIENLTTILITTLQSPSLKLAGAMRTIGWLRRVAPDLTDDGRPSARTPATPAKYFDVAATSASEDGALGSVFLVCRLHTLRNTLNALEPLRDLADQETSRRKQGINSKLLKQQVSASALGSQSERYVKRYIEIFREQSFNIISMYKSIFPSGLPTSESEAADSLITKSDGILPLPSPLASFALHLVDMLTDMLKEYMPNVTDKQARESLLTQVLYCAGSLGRLGADFGMIVALLEDDLRAEVPSDAGGAVEAAEQGPEWVEVMKKHRVQASRLEVLARGVGTRKASGDVQSPGSVTA
jgi:conserved oligomeric Golgi complex subunit 8